MTAGAAPRFGWVLNLDAELELVRPGYVPRQALLAQLAEHGAGARALLGPHDVLVDATTRGAEGLIGRAWSPTPLARRLLEQAGITPEPHPDAAVLRRVNHRRFAHEVGGGLPGQRYVEELAEALVLIQYSAGPWLAKRPLAFAGRGQQRFYGTVSDKQRSWLEVSFARDGLIFEPLVEPVLELSLHGFVWPSGRFELGRPCVQIVSERGVFRGVRLSERGDLSSEEEAALRESGERVATALGGAGYFGPFGIDAFRYRHEGRLGFCALSEINARYTMGFVTGFPRPPHELLLSE